jgi:hypothetical protein
VERTGKRAALGGEHPSLDIVERAQSHRHPSAGKAQASVAQNHVSRQTIDPRGHRLALAAHRDRPPVPHDQVSGLRVITAGRRVRDRLLRGAVLAVPGRGAAVQLGHQFRGRTDELVPQQLREEVVVAVPLASLVERHQEQVGALDTLELLRGVPIARHGVAQRRAEPLQDRGAQQELAKPLRLFRQDLLQVVADMSVVRRQRLHAGVPVRVRLDRQRPEPEAGGPPLGARVERSDVARVEAQAE